MQTWETDSQNDLCQQTWLRRICSYKMEPVSLSLVRMLQEFRFVGYGWEFNRKSEGNDHAVGSGNHLGGFLMYTIPGLVINVLKKALNKDTSDFTYTKIGGEALIYRYAEYGITCFFSGQRVTLITKDFHIPVSFIDERVINGIDITKTRSNCVSIHSLDGGHIVLKVVNDGCTVLPDGE